MTRRERLEHRAEQRREWADKAEARSDAAHDRVHQIADGIPFGQPILVGHHSERRARADQRRMESGMKTSVEESRKADRHEHAADEIERQLARSVFSDDEDAVERLREQIVELEAQRDRLKAFNASCRKGSPDESLLDDRQRADIASIRAVVPYQLSKGGGFPSYATAYLGKTIREKTKRIDQITRQREMAAAGERGHGRAMESRYAGSCAECVGQIERGQAIVWYRTTREALHAECDAPLDGALVVAYGRLTDSELDDLAEGDVRQERRAARREIAHRTARRAAEEGNDGE